MSDGVLKLWRFVSSWISPWAVVEVAGALGIRGVSYDLQPSSSPFSQETEAKRVRPRLAWTCV